MCVIETMKGCDVLMWNKPGAFIYSYIDELIYVKSEDYIALILVKTDLAYEQ